MANDTEVSDEQTPLIKKPDDAPLPMVQILLLCIARLVEPIAFFALFTYCPQMIKDTGDVESEKNVGFVSGAIESIFSITQVFALPFWGRVSDTYGRKPVLLISLAGVGVSMILFGFSTHVWQMAVSRSFAGAFAGSVVTLRTSLAELSTPKTQARAFSYLSFSTNIGLFVGPLVGGILARPSLQYPSVFAGVWLFERFPYCLPSLFSAALSFAIVLLMVFFLEETLSSEEERKEATKGVDTSMKAILRIPGIFKVMAITATFVSNGFAYTALCPLYEFTSIEDGGLSFSPLQISIFVCIGGVAQSLWILFVFPPLQKRLGTKGVLTWCSYFWPLTYLLIGVVMSAIRRSSAPDAVFYASMGIFAALASGVSMGFTCVQMMANHIAPSPVFLGALNGLSSSTMAIARIFAPVAVTSLYAAGIKWGHLYGTLAWWVLMLFALCQIPIARSLPASADSKPWAEAISDEED